MMFGTEHPLILMETHITQIEKSKNTSSSVWMSCTDKDIDGSYYYAKVYALNSAGTRIDVSHGYEYYFDVNDSHNMLNWVYEGTLQYDLCKM